MTCRKLFSMFTLGALLVGAMSWTISAGEETGKTEGKAEGRRGSRRGGEARGKDEGGPGGRFDPEQARQSRMERYKELLGVTDEEWKALQPKMEKVMTAQREVMAGAMGGFFGGRGGPGGGPGGQDTTNQSPVAKATSDLRTAIEDKSASAEDIGKKLAALRQARDKAREDWTKAQKELKELLTQKQEATLVLRGMLE
jgi:hypothetical protein